MGRKKSLKQNLLIALLAGSAALYTMPIYAATSVIANNALPTGGQFYNGSEFIKGDQAGNFQGLGSITKPNDLTMNIHQNADTAVIKWGSFDIGGSATVNFTSNAAKFNTLNFVNSGAASQIYGTINADGGNIYVVNPAGVQIGNSAQINVGSLYVSSNTLDDNALTNFYNNANNDGFVLGGTSNADIELMSLGNINANKVTFEGDGRIVIDSERIKNTAGDAVNNNFEIHTNDVNNVIIGYEAYNDGGKKGTYEGKDKTFNNVYLDGSTTASGVKGYMWVEDVEQLQAINTNLTGNYALRNSIDATSTATFGFTAIGTDNDAFKGKLEGLGNNIFSLTVNSTGDSGLFAATNGASISNVNLIGGNIAGSGNVGALIGSATNTTITNVTNTANVTGKGDTSITGGIVGAAQNTTLNSVINTGTVNGVNNVGGLAGELRDTDTSDKVYAKITGTSYNLGAVTGSGYNVGGLVGSAENATIGDGTNLVYNRLDVTGAYNVGGIVGSMDGSTVQNAENSGNVAATSFTEEIYKFHTSDSKTDTKNNGKQDGFGEEKVQIANAGGIAGNSINSNIEKVQNSGDVTSSKDSGNDFYNAGNVGGVVGRAEKTNIINAVNKENDIRGAHNVGGIAGYFGGSYGTNDTSYTIKNSQNSGGDIMATGARYKGNWVTETVRKDGSGGSNEAFHVGNMGGIAGYVSGDNTYIKNSSNSGNVHSLDITTTTISEASKAANTGGIAGKLDRSDTETLDDVKQDPSKAAISGSYNTGAVRGFTGIGGVVGMMYNGEVAQSYNVGTIKSTRKTSSNYEPSNLGGIVGDATELTNASALIYDVYNTGQIGDETYTTYARHVGGIVGRFSGTLEKAYNTGNIYNNDTDNGGIIGYWYKGDIKDVFNTGNITINGQLGNRAETGGIVGGVYANNYGGGGKQTFNLTNVYNLGSIRVMDKSDSSVAGIIGGASQNGTGMDLTIKNVYTTGDIYVGNNQAEAITTIMKGNHIEVVNAAYIAPSEGFSGLKNNHGATCIDSNADKSAWDYFIANSKENPSDSDVWRIYDGTTPILNAFTPNSQGYVDKNIVGNGITVQYGTAYNPLLTIINGNGETIYFDWSQAGITGMAGLVVNGSDLVINNVNSTGNTLYSGTIYTDRALTINTAEGGNISLGSASKIYGSSVNINADGNLLSYGTITSTGAKGDNGNINIEAGNIDNYGVISSTANGETVTVAGIGKNYTSANYNTEDIKNAYVDLPSAGDRYSITAESKSTNADINFTGSNDVNLHYGNAEKGYVHAAGDLNIKSTDGNVFSDSDLFVGGNLSMSAKGESLLSLTNIGQVQSKIFINDIANAIRGLKLTGSDDSAKITEIIKVLDNAGIFSKYGISNNNDKSAIGQYILQDINNNLVIPTDTLKDQSALRYLHQFLAGFGTDSKKISLNGSSSKLTINMWDSENGFDLDKYDIKTNQDDISLVDALNSLNVEKDNKKVDAKDITYIEITNAEQLASIQKYKDNNTDSGILGYNFTLMNDIDASKVNGYEAIGSGDTAYTGIFDGRDHRIIGLEVNGNDAGIFGTVGNGGTVENLRVYSSKFNGTDTAGAIAGINKGTIKNIVTLGNEVSAAGSDNSIDIDNNTVKVGAAGGIAGINYGTVDDVETVGSVIAGDATDDSGALSTAGGIVGINHSNATVNNSYSNSAVTASSGTTYGLGGIAGVNNGTLSKVDSLGVTRGLYKDNTGKYVAQSGQVGGLAGINTGTINSGYNESIVNGSSEIGGIAGVNNGGKITNVVNAANVTGDGENTADGSYTGGLVGKNSGSITNGRNNGEITGHEYVGGLVGSNAKGSTLTNLVNDSSASITGDSYVGGIAGSNAGTITADEDNNNLINRGSITGNQYVGGVAGLNTGTITNTLNSVVLNATGKDAKYFGGVVGQNSGVIDGATNTSDIDITAVGGTLVGGIIGHNTDTGTLKGEILNQGSVTGTKDVGGIIGQNDNKNVLQGTEDKRLTVTNEGTVKAESGGAAGIFYTNNGQINYADIINKGTVIGGDGATGGLFGTNSGAITNSTLTNSGIVTGGGTVGGLIGENSGDISTSSLKNEADAIVIGINNVGGLIGINTGTIKGGRDDYNSYYKYQIYNNGVINVGTWTDGNNDGVVDTGEITSANGSNIGGLIGSNEQKGSLTAGYNTGAINAADSENVGGIAGSNSGTIDQVFNTVMTPDNAVKPDGSKQEASITGGTNVGGLVGDNTGTITNAYNTSNVVATNQDDIVGNLVGTNTGEVKFVYGVANNLIGSGTDAVNGYVIDTSDQWKQEGSYAGFTFRANGWKIYNGYSNPMLSVFLTKVTVVDQHLVNQYFSAKHYGELHQITADDIKALIAIGAISAPDGFGAFNNNNGLIQGVADDAMANSGNWLYSQQILGSNINGLFNPNNLGYDISLVYSPFELDNDPSSHWNYLFNDAPFDRNKDFRERKAEVNFVDGGMEI